MKTQDRWTVGAIGALVIVAMASGCGARSALESGPEPGDEACVAPLVCVAAGADACAPPREVPAICDAPGRAFHCPDGAAPYTRQVDQPGVCLPFFDPAGPIQSLDGSLVRVPTDDGRCLWIAEDVGTRAGDHLRNVAFAPPTGAAGVFGACPSGAPVGGTSPTSIVRVEGVDDPDVLVQLTGSFRLAGATQITYRLFQLDSDAAFGVTLLGSGFGVWDPKEQRIVVGDASSLSFGTHLDLGDASLLGKDSLFIWGCPRQEGLVDGCIEGRFDGADAGKFQLLGEGRTWLTTHDPALATTVYTSGPWISSVVKDQGGLLHLFAEGFGGALETQTATVPEGPWSSSSTLTACSLPADPKAFCAGPVIHEELIDPTRSELVVSYGVGTTAAGGAPDAASSWPRLVWIAR